MTLLTMTTLCLSLLAAFLAIGAIAATRRGSVVSLSKQLFMLSERVEASDLVCERLVADLKGMRLARNMAAYRERHREQSYADGVVAPLHKEMSAEGPEFSEQRKEQLRAELNTRLALGQASALKPGV